MKTLIIGRGMMGGSIEKAFKKYNITQNIFIVDENILLEQPNIAKENILSNNFDLIVIACHLKNFKKIAEIVSADKKAIIFDVMSKKDFDINFNDNFVLCHPMAGSHKRGYENANPDLFVGKKWFICASKENSYTACYVITDIATKIGAIVESRFTTKEHDYAMASFSWLPQYLSFLPNAKFNFFNKFFDCFRLENSSKDLWNPIFEEMKNNKSISDFIKQIEFCNTRNQILTFYKSYMLTEFFIKYDNIKTFAGDGFYSYINTKKHNFFKQLFINYYLNKKF